MSTNYAPFDGDGRNNAPQPSQVRPGTHPMTVTNASARRSISHFLKTGVSTHSAMGGTLWVIEAWAKQHGRKIEVELQASVGAQKVGGYIVRLVEPAAAQAAEGARPARVSAADKQDARAFIHLRSAIRTARDAADKAERSLTMYANAPGAAVASVLNALAWGHANASSSIETAMSCVDDAHEVRALEAAEAAKAGKA